MTRRRSPEEIEDTEHDAALALLLSPAADRFARALDMHGWMIVSQPEYDDAPQPARWFMNGSKGHCPAWADPKCPPDPPGTRYGLRRPAPALRLIDGGKDNDPDGDTAA